MHAVNHTENLNTPRLVADDTQKTVWKWEQQEPFGAGACNPDPDGDNVQFEFNLRFPGQYFDRETNLHYNYFRDYDPGLARYAQSDPIGLRGGPNTYAYVRSDTLRWIDPLGLCRASPKMLECLKEVFGDGVDSVSITRDPDFVFDHLGPGVQGAVTRPGKIYISMPCDDFWGGPPEFVLHEYYHVVRQWADGMTILSYIFSFVAKEREAEEFARENGRSLRKCLSGCRN